MQLILCALIVIIIVWSVNRWRSSNHVKLAYKVPSNRWHTMLGWGSLVSPKDAIKILYEHGCKYGPNSVFWLGPYSYFLSSDPEVLKQVLTSKNCIDKPMELYNGLVLVAGQGLITESEPIWGEHRKLLNKAFSNKNLISFLPQFHATTDNFIQNLEKRVEKGETIDMLILLRVLTLNNATQTTLKRNLEYTKFSPTTMSKNFQALLQFTTDVCLHQFLKINWVRKLAEIYTYKSVRAGASMFKNLVDESVDVALKNDTTDPSYIPEVNSVLDYTLNGAQQNALDMEDIHGVMIHLFFAAFETTSTALFFALALLAMHPEYQERAHEEISQILPDDDIKLTINEVAQLTYIEMIFNETMRVLPIVPMVFRKVSNEDFTLSNGLTLPINQKIAIDIFRLHRAKEFWGPEADAFNPDNFLPSNVAARHPYCFIPFTKGLRSCIGWKYSTLLFKITLAKLIKTFKFSTDFKYKDLKFENYIVLKLAEQPKLQLERRKASDELFRK